jgi:hypothetical protein
MNDNRPRPATGGFPYFRSPSPAPAADLRSEQPSAQNDNGLPPPPPTSGAAAPSARQAEEGRAQAVRGTAEPAVGKGAAGARRAGKKPVAAAAPKAKAKRRANIPSAPPPAIPQGADRWAPRPKPHILKQEPAIGWRAAGDLQRKRRQALRAPSSYAILGKLNRRQAEESAEQQRRAECPIEQAVLALRRRGRVVYRMSVHGGDHDLFFVQGLGRDRTADDVLELAAKVAA